MNRITRRMMLLLGLATAFVASSLRAEDTPSPSQSMLTVTGMHCGACAKKISGKLQAVAGVETVTADVEGGLITVTPKAGANPSPREMWEAVESAGYKMVQLEGPGGTFTEKPKA